MIQSRIKRALPKSLAWLGMAVLIAALPAPATPAQKELPSLHRDTASTQIIDSLIPWLLNENQHLRGIPFAEVILDTTGKHVLRVDPKNETDQRVIKQISAALDDVMKRANRSDSPIQSIGRINEVSSHFEDWLHALLNSTPSLNCDFPRTADGKMQRSGYPDLRIVDLASKHVFYLDPKLYVAGSRDSSFRAFYFEPKIATNKIHHDAVHLLRLRARTAESRSLELYALGPRRSCALQREIESRVSRKQSR